MTMPNLPEGTMLRIAVASVLMIPSTFRPANARKAIDQLGGEKLENIDFQDAAYENDLLSQICLRFLTYEELIERTIPTEEIIQRKMKEYRFLNYAAHFWYLHAQNRANWSKRLISLTNTFSSSDAEDGLYG